MNKPRLILLLAFAVINIAGCSKKTEDPVSKNSKLRMFKSDAEMKHALGEFLTGYHGYIDYGSNYADFLAGTTDQRFQVVWGNKGPGGIFGYHRAVLGYIFPKERFLKTSVYGMWYKNPIADSRLGKPPYSNIDIFPGDNDKPDWSYRMFILDDSGTYVEADIIVYGGFNVPAGSAMSEEVYEAGPEQPTETEAVNALLSLLEPANDEFVFQ